MAICMILLLFAIPISIAEASETSYPGQANEVISIEIKTLNEAEEYLIETVFLSEEELVQLEAILSTLIEEIESANNLEEIEYILENLPMETGVITSLLSKIISMIKSITKGVLSRFKIFQRSFVISSGRGYKLNPFKRNEIKIRKTLSFWHYSSSNLLKSRTIIFEPLALKMKVLKGLQFGFMSRFTGIYIFVSRKLPEKSYTFFMGMARRANGIEFLPNT